MTRKIVVLLLTSGSLLIATCQASANGPSYRSYVGTSRAAQGSTYNRTWRTGSSWRGNSTYRSYGSGFLGGSVGASRIDSLSRSYNRYRSYDSGYRRSDSYGLYSSPYYNSPYQSPSRGFSNRESGPKYSY